MTCTLILSRHAKSAWGTEAPSDHARPLNKRGRRSAEVLGDWLRSRKYVPDLVISSSSQRTRETFARMSLTVPVVFTERLYLASADIILNVLTEAEAPKVMILGHNPGIAAFAHQLVKSPPEHHRFDDFPTGSTLVADFDIKTWDKVKWSSGKVRDFIVPRELLQAWST
jgi:phosphohistidine phosphatase